MNNQFKSNNLSKFIPSASLAEGYTVIPNGIMNNISNMQPATFTVFAKILQYISNPMHKISIQGLSTQTGMSKDRVSKSIKELISIGYIVRTPIKNGNLTNGYVYEIFDTPQRTNVENTNVLRNPVIKDTEIQDTGAQYANKENNNKKNNNKKNIDDEKSVAPATKVDELSKLYWSFKLEDRFTPHMKKLLVKYVDCFNMDVFEEIFIYASSDSVDHKYHYLRDTFADMVKNNVKTLKDYHEYNAKRKSPKSKGSSTSKAPVVKSRFHNINESFRNYDADELERLLKENQKGKFETAVETEIPSNVNKCTLDNFALNTLANRSGVSTTVLKSKNMDSIMALAKEYNIKLVLNESTGEYRIGF